MAHLDIGRMVACLHGFVQNQRWAHEDASIAAALFIREVACEQQVTFDEALTQIKQHPAWKDTRLHARPEGWMLCYQRTMARSGLADTLVRKFFHNREAAETEADVLRAQDHCRQVDVLPLYRTA